MSRRNIPRAVHADTNCIRVEFDEDEPPAVAFDDRALPGALVSWAYSQLSSLDTLLELISMGGSDEGGSEAAEAARSFLGPALNALAYSEIRAHEIRRDPSSPPSSLKKRRKAGRKPPRKIST